MVAAPPVEQTTEWFNVEDYLAEEDGPPPLPRREHHVTAVIVSHDGAVWLPAVLTTLAGQTRQPDQAVGVDTARSRTAAPTCSPAPSAARAPSCWTTGRCPAVQAGLDRPRPAGAGAGPLERLRPGGLGLAPALDDSAPARTASPPCAIRAETTTRAPRPRPRRRRWGGTTAGSCSRPASPSPAPVDASPGWTGASTTRAARRRPRRHGGELLHARAPRRVGGAGRLRPEPSATTSTSAGASTASASACSWPRMPSSTTARPRPMDGVPMTWRRARPEPIVQAAVHVLLAHASALAAPFVALRLILGSLCPRRRVPAGQGRERRATTSVPCSRSPELPSAMRSSRALCVGPPSSRRGRAPAATALHQPGAPRARGGRRGRHHQRRGRADGVGQRPGVRSRRRPRRGLPGTRVQRPAPPDLRAPRACSSCSRWPSSRSSAPAACGRRRRAPGRGAPAGARGRP